MTPEELDGWQSVVSEAIEIINETHGPQTCNPPCPMCLVALRLHLGPDSITEEENDDA